MSLTHVATRLFNVPLLIERRKLEAILAAIGPRLGVARNGEATPTSLGPGDNTGKPRKDYFVTQDGVAVIDIVGPLVRRSSGEFMSGGPTTYGEIENEFLDAATDPAIKGILLQIDSPGGECSGCFELADMIYQQRGAKPIYAVADGDAFSAAYAIASAADRIYVSKTGGVGSVGVWTMHVDQSEFNAKEGFKPTFIYAGARKLDGNPHAPLTDEARAAMQDRVDGLYQMFVGAVARNRRMTPKQVMQTEAGLFWGEPKSGEPGAMDIGFADHVGALREALSALTMEVRGQVRGQTTQYAGAEVAGIEKEQEMAEQTLPTAGTPAVNGPTIDVAAEVEKARLAGQQAASEIMAEIADLCSLAGFPSKCAEFISAKLTVPAVRAELMKLRAEAQEKAETRSHVQVAASPLAQIEAQASEIMRRDGRTKEQAAVAVINANPKLYDQYLQANPAQTGARQ